MTYLASLFTFLLAIGSSGYIGAAEAATDPIAKAIEAYSDGSLTSGDFVSRLRNFDSRSGNKKTNAAYRKILAEIAYTENLGVLAARFAADSLKISTKPLSDAMELNWEILSNVSKSYSVQYILEDLARNVSLEEKYPPFFGNDWNYVMANALHADNKLSGALAYYLKLNAVDRYFLPAQYQAALIYQQLDDIENAKIALGMVISPESRSISPLSAPQRKHLFNYAHMAIARISYANRDFTKASQHYRMVSRGSHLFYRSLFEQSWSLFMGGNPQHALGTLHGAASPFFAEEFNPEVKVLEAMVYYWLCRYEDARNSLADFAENHSKSIELLSSFVGRQRLSAETSYQLFENLISGVSDESLGIPSQVLKTAAEQDTMLLLREQYATVLEETQKLDSSALAGNDQAHTILGKIVDGIGLRLRKEIGEQYLAELRNLKREFDELYDQSQFLYLELMMSEKEQLLGRELHSDTKVTIISEAKNIKGWSGKAQSWGVEEKDEYWWDEIGYHIVNVEPKCNT